MKTVPKKFRCKECKRETYTDYKKCDNCNGVNTSEPINREHYKCYLNGKFYGSGNLKYMHELFKDYVITCKMYGREDCKFKIIKCEVG
jgi:hypothetical protein